MRIILVDFLRFAKLRDLFPGKEKNEEEGEGQCLAFLTYTLKQCFFPIWGRIPLSENLEPSPLDRGR
jgi:hypothetical protein